MPDLATHITVAYLANKRAQLSAPMIMTGAVLPDISRAMLFILPYHRYHLEAFHAPLTTLALAALLCLGFRPGTRRFVLLSVVIGAATHYLLDLFQYHYSGGYYWFFPFSLARYEIGIAGTEDSLFVLPLLLIVAGILIWREKHR